MIPRFAYCIFCDDIRHEVGEKRSFMGVYGDKLFARAFPIHLPKLCVSAYFSTPADRLVVDLKLKLSFNGKEQVFPIPKAELDRVQHDVEQRAKEERFESITFATDIVQQGFVVEQESTLSVFLIADNEEFLAGRLLFRVGDSPA